MAEEKGRRKWKRKEKDMGVSALYNLSYLRAEPRRKGVEENI
jgi:hypothetical protein